MVGKAERGPAAIEAIRKHKAAYLMAVGGAAYLVAKAIRKSRVLAFEDLGMEAIYEFEVKDMPVTVAVDANGDSVHQTGRPSGRSASASSRSRCGRLVALPPHPLQIPQAYGKPPPRGGLPDLADRRAVLEPLAGLLLAVRRRRVERAEIGRDLLVREVRPARRGPSVLHVPPVVGVVLLIQRVRAPVELRRPHAEPLGTARC